LPLPTSLGGAPVYVNGAPVPLFYASGPQINFLVPQETSPRLAHVAVRVNGVQSNGQNVTMPRTAPAFFTFSPTDNNPSAGTLLAALNGVRNHVPVEHRTFGLPAQPGDTLEIYLTGRGAATTENTTVTLTDPHSNKRTLKPDYIGPAPDFAGQDQANLKLPADLPTGAVTLEMCVNDGAPLRTSARDTLVAKDTTKYFAFNVTNRTGRRKCSTASTMKRARLRCAQHPPVIERLTRTRLPCEANRSNRNTHYQRRN